MWIGVAPVPAVLHRVLNVFAALVRFKAMSSISWLAPLMFRVINVLRWGEHRGGMFVAVEGDDSLGHRVAREWHLIAEADDGPMIPSMSAEAIIRHCLDRRRPETGARAAISDLELSDYEVLFARRKIYTGVRKRPAPVAPLYRHLLGDAYEALPEPIRTLHNLSDALSFAGRASVERGSGFLARLIAAAIGFPPPASDVAVKVNLHLENGREVWRRNFADCGFLSTQEAGRGRFERLMVERFGPFAFGIALLVESDRLRLVVRRWNFLGVPLPARLAPIGNAYESVENGRFRFFVEIKHFVTGLVVRYHGWLEPSARPPMNAR